MSSLDPVFILASPHSKVSLVAAMLGQHPGLYAVPELNLFAADRLVEMQEALAPAHTQGLVRAIAQLYCGEQTLETVEAARRWLYRRVYTGTAEIHQELCRKVAPLRLVDPSGVHGEARRGEDLERILTAYPDACFLHLVRHPRSQAEAWLSSPHALAQLFALDALDASARQTTPDPLIDWYRRNAAIADRLDDIPADRWLRVRLEDLLSVPRSGLRAICDWLGLAWSEPSLEAMLHPERGSYSGLGPYGAEGGGDVDFLRAPRFQLMPRDTRRLKDVVPWRPDGREPRPELMALARAFGYS